MPPKATSKTPVKKKPAAAAAKPKVAAGASKAAVSKSEPAAAAPAEVVVPPVLDITLKELPDTVFRDVGNKRKESGKSVTLLIDRSGQASTFLRYQNVNYLESLNTRNMATEAIRLALIGSLRYGKALVIDMMEFELFKRTTDLMDEVLPGLMNMIFDNSILQEENYLKLVKPVDGPEYDQYNFSPERLEEFQLIFNTTNLDVPDDLLRRMFGIRIN